MGRAKVIFDGLTKDQAVEKIYSIAEKNGYRTRTDLSIELGSDRTWPEMATEDFQWVTTILIPRHGSAKVKIGGGVSKVVFGKNSRCAHRKSSRPPCCMYVMRTDGSITDVSWRECLNPSDYRSKVLNAMRSAVREQMTDYRSSIDLFWVCGVCGLTRSDASMEIDHHPKPFLQIAEEWLASESCGFEDISVSGEQDLLVGDKFADDNAMKKWADFHRKSTENGLRPLCKECHKRLKRK